MNRKSCLSFIVLGFCFSGVFATPSRSALKKGSLEAESTFYYKTHLNVESNYRLEVKDVKVTLNGRLLQPLEMIRKSKYLSIAFSSAPNTPSIHCTAGYFIHEVKKKGKTQIEKGCLTDPRFKLLSIAFSRIEK